MLNQCDGRAFGRQRSWGPVRFQPHSPLAVAVHTCCGQTTLFTLVLFRQVGLTGPFLCVHCSRLKSLSDKLQKGQFTVEDDDDDCVVVEAATPDAEKEVLVKVKSRSGIQKFPMKKVRFFCRD